MSLRCVSEVGGGATERRDALRRLSPGIIRVVSAHAASGSSSRDRDGGARDLDLGSVGADVDGEVSGSPEILTLMDGDGGG